jgi:integrase/recombinase XerD
MTEDLRQPRTSVAEYGGITRQRKAWPTATAFGGTVAASIVVPQVIAAAGDQAARRFLEFFAATIRNKNTRLAYYHAAGRFFAWCDHHKVGELADIEPLHVAAYVEALGKDFEKPTVKQHLAAIRMLFDWLVTGQVVATNPAHSVRGPKHVVKTGKTTVLTGDEARELLDSIDTSTVVGLRDRALISVMTFAFARIGAVVGMRVEDYYPQGKRWWVRLHEKGGKRHEMPAHHNLEAYLDAYIEAAGIREAGKAPLFRSAIGRTGVLTDKPMHRIDAYRIIQRRAADLGRVTSEQGSVAIPSALQASPPILKRAARSRTRRPWPRMKVRAPPSFMIGQETKSRSMRSSGLRFERLTFAQKKY